MLVGSVRQSVSHRWVWVIVVASFFPSPVVGGGIMRAPAASHPPRTRPPSTSKPLGVHPFRPAANRLLEATGRQLGGRKEARGGPLGWRCAPFVAKNRLPWKRTSERRLPENRWRLATLDEQRPTTGRLHFHTNPSIPISSETDWPTHGSAVWRMPKRGAVAVQPRAITQGQGQSPHMM